MDSVKFNKEKNKNRIGAEIVGMMPGKIPPQSKELEESVLGAIMLEKGLFDTVSEILKPECFYFAAHEHIFRCMGSLQDKQLPIDILTVVEELKANSLLEKIGGPYTVAKLTNAVVGTAHVEAHARILLQKFVQRELIRISGDIIIKAYDEGTDVFDLLDEAEEKIYGVTNLFLKSDYQEMGTALAKTLERIDELRTKQEDISGVPSGFPTLDRITFGWQPTDLIILAARPSVGKTAFALNLARNAALSTEKPSPVAFFSLEMGAGQLVQRILSAESEIALEKINRGKMEEYEYQQLHKKGINRLEVAPIYIDDTAALNIFELRAKARRLVKKHGVKIIIIDYLQLMSGSGDKNGNREQEISNISRNLKSLAKELNVPILALSQLSRAVETRKETNKVPQLSDLRESGAIEQDADMVMFIYRPEYHEVLQNAEGESTKGETFVKIAKHRNGSLESVKFRANLAIQKFYDEGLADGQSFASPNGGFRTTPQAQPANGGGYKVPSGDTGDGGGGGSFFIQESKMNTTQFNNDPPF